MKSFLFFIALALVACSGAHEPERADLTPPKTTAMNVAVGPWTVFALYPSWGEVILNNHEQTVTWEVYPKRAETRPAEIVAFGDTLYEARLPVAGTVQINARTGKLKAVWDGQLFEREGSAIQIPNHYARR